MANSWELINGAAAERIDVLNYRSSLNLIEVKLLTDLDRYGRDPSGGCARPPNSKDIAELHRIGTGYLLEKPGELRERHVQIKDETGRIHHDPPPQDEVPGHLRDLDRALAQAWPHSNAARLGACVLWGVNWVHPFVNGNGHAARAAAYLTICYKFGFMLPGKETVVDMITADRRGYIRNLTIATNTLQSTGKPDLWPLENFLAEKINRQLASRPHQAADPPGAPSDLAARPAPIF